MHVGLCRDDGLIFTPDYNGPKTSKIHKKIIRAFHLLEFKIEISPSLKIVKFLNMTFNLTHNTLKLFSKDKKTPTYTNINSN